MSHPGETTRILLVGDDRAVYLALRDALSAGRALGFELEWVDDADAALAKMRSGEFSLVLVGDDAWRYSDVLKRQDPRAVVVVVRRGADERVETALIEAMMRLDLQRRSGPASVGPSAG